MVMLHMNNNCEFLIESYSSICLHQLWLFLALLS